MQDPFIPPLIDYVRLVGTTEDYQHVKVVGICFGHQIVSMAMGGICIRGDRGWEVGVYGMEITEAGKIWLETSSEAGQGSQSKIVSPGRWQMTDYPVYRANGRHPLALSDEL